MPQPKYSKKDAKDVAREKIRGVITAPCTPIDERGEVDEAGLRHDIRYCLDELKIDGLYINGYYAHFWLATSEQRKRVIEIAVEEIDGRVPIINRCAHASPLEAINLAKHCQDLGVDFISLVIPQFGGAHKDILLGYFAMIAEEIELGISIFNTDQAGYNISPELMAELAEIPNVCALKNGLPLEHTNQIRSIVGNSIVVIDPEEERFFVNMSEHGQQAVYGGSNMMMDSHGSTGMLDYVHAGLRGDLDEARRLHDAIQPLRDLHHRWVLEPWWSMGLCPISTIKYWTGLLGMTGGPTPRPLPDLLSEQDKEKLRAEMEEVGLLRG